MPLGVAPARAKNAAAPAAHAVERDFNGRLEESGDTLGKREDFMVTVRH